MKKLLALLLTALILFTLPVSPVRGDEGEAPAATPETRAEPKPTEAPTAPPTPDQTPAPQKPSDPAPTEKPADPATPAPTEKPEEPVAPTPTEKPETPATPAPTEKPEEPAALTPTDRPEEPATPAPTETPEPAEEPERTAEPEPTGKPEADAEDEEDAEGGDDLPHDKPRYRKSLEYWEEQRQSLELTGDLEEDILIVAREQLGYSADRTCYELDKNGKKRYYTRYGAWDGAKFCDWCDAFVCFCVYYGGLTGYPKESSCNRHMMALKRTGYWREWNSYIPQKGDIVFFALGKNQVMPNHVGIVEEVVMPADGKPGYLITIEGNQTNPTGKTPCVRRMTRTLESVVGYGTYKQGKTYPEGNSIRPRGVEVIGEDSRYFMEAPTREALAFLGMTGTRYYEHWFPEETAEAARATAAPQTQGKQSLLKLPQADRYGLD